MCSDQRSAASVHAVDDITHGTALKTYNNWVSFPKIDTVNFPQLQFRDL